MRKLIDITILALIVGIGIYLFKTPYYPCDTPVSYKIGSIDPKFKLSTNDVLSDTESAANIWDTAYGKRLFAYSASGEIAVNFVFDQRTALDLNINSQKNQLDQTNKNLDAQVAAYNSDVAALEQKFKDLNATIQRYNSQGGAPPDVYTSLFNQAQELQAEGDALNKRADQLNLATRDYNSQVANINSNVNTFNQALVAKPEEGFYDGKKKTITIYFANNKSELVHTLAHEFGHALGLTHVEDSKAIMFAETSPSLTLTSGDREELQKACQSYPMLNHLAYFFKGLIYSANLSN